MMMMVVMMVVVMMVVVMVMMVMNYHFPITHTQNMCIYIYICNYIWFVHVIFQLGDVDFLLVHWSLKSLRSSHSGIWIPVSGLKSPGQWRATDANELQFRLAPDCLKPSNICWLKHLFLCMFCRSNATFAFFLLVTTPSSSIEKWVQIVETNIFAPFVWVEHLKKYIKMTGSSHLLPLPGQPSATARDGARLKWGGAGVLRGKGGGLPLRQPGGTRLGHWGCWRFLLGILLGIHWIHHSWGLDD